MHKGWIVIKNLWEKGLVSIFTGTFLTKVLSFFGSIFLIHVLSKREYGILSYLETFYGYVFIFAGFGTSNAILRYVVLGKSKQEKFDFFSYACKVGAVWNLFLVIIGIAIGMYYNHPEPYRDFLWLLCVLLLTIPFQYIVDNVLCNERALFENRRYAIYTIFLTAIVILGKISAGNEAGIVGVIFYQIVAYFVLSVLYLRSTIKKHYRGLKAKILPTYLKREINIYSLQYMITNGLWAIFMLNDTFLLGRYCSPEIVAEYRVAYTIPGSVTLINNAIGIFVAPYFVKNEENRKWVKSTFRKTYLITAGFVGLICIIISIFSKLIISLLYGEQYSEINRIMLILLIAAFLNCGLRYTTANVLAAMGKIKYNMIISGIGLIMQLIINMNIVPTFGAVGVAVTSCGVYGFMALCLLAIFYLKVIPMIKN